MFQTFLTLPPEDLDWAPCTCTGACSDSLEELHLQKYGLQSHPAPAHPAQVDRLYKPKEGQSLIAPLVITQAPL